MAGENKPGSPVKESIISQESFFKAIKLSSERTTTISFPITEAIAESGKPKGKGNLQITA